MSGLSDKVGMFIQQVSVFLVAMCMALVVNWRLSLAVMSLTPLMTAMMIGAVLVSVKPFQNNCTPKIIEQHLDSHTLFRAVWLLCNLCFDGKVCLRYGKNAAFVQAYPVLQVNNYTLTTSCHSAHKPQAVTDWYNPHSLGTMSACAADVFMLTSRQRVGGSIRRVQ